MATVRLHDGSTLDVRSHGDGPAILMHPQPGWQALPAEHLQVKAELERLLVDRLSDRYRIVLCEYPGSPKPATLTPQNVVADLLAIADAAEAERFGWCGYSWTAVIGIQLAIATDRLSAFVCGGWPAIDGPYDVMLDTVAGRADDEAQQFATFYRELQDFDDRSVQHLITCPRLCFAGSDDDVYDSGIGRRVVETRAELEQLGWDVRVLDGVTHGGGLAPEVFVPLVSEWLDTVVF